MNQWFDALRCLTRSESHRLEEYFYQDDVKFSLIGQLFVRYLFSRIFDEKSSSCEIHRTSFNRPFIPSHPSLDFNLSHHYQLLTIAGTLDQRIGCDTMLYRTARKAQNNYRNLTRKILTKDEEKDLFRTNSDENQRYRDFVRFWCLKESYVKWLGKGLTFPLSKLNFQISSSFNQTILTDTRLEHLSDLRFDEQLISLENDEQQLITLCLSKSNPIETFIQLTIDDLLDRCTPFDDQRIDQYLSWKRFENKPLKEII